MASTGDETTGEDTGEAFVPDETEFNIFNTDMKLAALESAAKMLSNLPEKKALVYFSSGVSKTGVENQSQLRSTVNAAAHNPRVPANSAICDRDCSAGCRSGGENRDPAQ